MKQPPIIFIFSDQQHWQALQSEDSSFTTPHLDRLSRDACLFTQAFCTTPQCSPSRSSLLTGLYPSKTGVWGNVAAAGGEPLRGENIGSMLQRVGYKTAYFGKWHLGKEAIGIAGWDEDFGVTQAEQLNDAEVTRRALAFIDAMESSDQPCALFLSYNNPHDIYHFKRDVPDELASPDLPETWHKQTFSSVPPIQEQFMREDQGKVIVDEREELWQHYRDFYRMKTKMYDDGLGLVLDALRGRGLYDQSLIISTSDHGDMDAQHKLIFKGPFLYDHLMRVPLIIKQPHAQFGAEIRRIDFPTVNVDLVPTLADYAGFTVAQTDGLSLRPFLEDAAVVPERAFVIGQYYSKQAWVNPIRMIRTQDFKYNLSLGFGEELYDLNKDPQELINRAHDADYAASKAVLRAQLTQWITDNDDPFFEQQASNRQGEPLAQTVSN